MLGFPVLEAKTDLTSQARSSWSCRTRQAVCRVGDHSQAVVWVGKLHAEPLMKDVENSHW